MRAEEQIQSSVIDYLHAAAPSLLVFAVPNASRRTPGGFASNGVPGLLKGVSDLVLLAPHGRAYFIEVKAEKGRLSQEQSEFMADLYLLGHSFAVVRSIDDMREALKA